MISLSLRFLCVLSASAFNPLFYWIAKTVNE